METNRCERVTILDDLSIFNVPDSLREDTTFEFMLTVIDKYGKIDTDTISIEAIANSEPEADAGSNKEAAISEQVTLDGTASLDPDPTGKIISFRWEQTGGPPVSLQGSTQPIASFSVPSVQEDSTFEFTLTVTDNENAPKKILTAWKFVTYNLAHTTPANLIFVRTPLGWVSQ